MEKRRSGFTLVELLITVTIIGMLAGMAIFAMYGAQEAAKRQKTEALIARIDAVLRYKWESYRGRRVPITIPPDEWWDDFDESNPNSPTNNNGRRDAGEPFDDANGNMQHDAYPAARMKVDALHDLMRLELPDRWTDISDNPVSRNYTSTGGATVAVGLPSRPAVSVGYLRKYTAAAPTGEHASSECLYMILQACSAEEGDDVSAILKPENIRDLDNDGAPEIVDAWTTPIKFIRWPAGFNSERSRIAECRMDGTPPGATNTMRQSEFWIVGNVPQTIPPGAALVGERVETYGSNKAYGLSLGFAQISSYVWEPDTMQTPPTPRARVICKTPATGTPFNGQAPGSGQTMFIMAPDPFDHAGVYRSDINASNVPVFNNTGPSFALYPLVVSAGPNKYFGLCFDFGNMMPLRYSAVASNLNPFIVDTDTAVGARHQIGSQRDDPAEPNATALGWTDNIHNHALGRR